MTTTPLPPAAAGDQQAAAAAARRFAERAALTGAADVAYAPIDSPLGPLLGALTQRGLLALSYPELDEQRLLERIATTVSPRIVCAPARLDELRRELDEYFGGRRTRFQIAIDWRLVGGFGRRVLGATSRIPYGATRSYKDVAGAAGSPRGSRAAGNALGANPVPIVVPCHRVIRGGGALGGYGGGPERKRFLLELEARARG